MARLGGLPRSVKFGLVALALLIPALAWAQGVGFFSRSNCTTLTSVVQGQTVCFDQTANKWKVWNGTAWVQPPPDVINIRDFGAVDDGVTDNCVATSATSNFFQNAINAATATTTNGGIVYIPTPNTRWLCSSGISVFVGASATPLAMFGDGKWASVIRYTGSGSFLAPAGGATAQQIRLEGFTVQLTNTAAIGVNASQFISSTLRSLRFAWSGAGSQGGTGISANPTNSSSTPFYNIVDDVTFDAVASGITLNAQVANAPNRWRILAPTFLAPNAANTVNGIVIGNGSTSNVSGIDIVAPYCDQLGGTCLWLGANTDRPTIVAARHETAQGGALFNINPAVNRLNLLGYASHAGSIGSTTNGVRSLVLGAWDDVHIGNSVNGSANLFDVNVSGANGGITLGGPTGSDKGVGTANFGASVWLNGSQMLTSSPAIIIGSATGGDKGAGTLNATAIYVNGKLVVTASGAHVNSSVTFASGLLNTLTADGMQIYCSDCTAAGALDQTCVGGGTGNLAVRVNGVAKCAY